MNAEYIIPKIHRQRENLMRACGYNVNQLVEHFHQREAGRKTGGHRLVSFVETANKTEAFAMLRDEPRKKGK